MLETITVPGERENCAVCMSETDQWYPPKDVPVCPQCSKRGKHHLVPSKQQWLEELGYDLPKDWRPKVEAKVRKRLKTQRRVQLLVLD
jgi:hypothetical protein